MILYVDTSAVSKLIIREAETTALTSYLDRHDGQLTIVSAYLLETELRRMAHRVGVAQSSITTVLRRFTLVDVDRSIFGEAGLIMAGTSLRSLDALHLAVALRVAADEFLTYDVRQAAAAGSLGFTVVRPG